ncbi:MAG: T9SS type A sorting domain-containing protein [Bacteroidetes bacterium]|nr:T9SS type A sorting domain-containing protein [Bacteroidota bacterium]
MKKLLLIAILVSFSLTLSSQSRVLLPKEKYEICVKDDLTSSESKAIEYNQPAEVARKTSALAPDEHIIGTTFWDFQTHNSLQNRIHRYDDGSIGAVWIRGMDHAASFPDVGTGYNFYDGTEWGPMPESRLESVNFKYCMPNYAPLGADGEIVISHCWAGYASILTRDVKGVGNWTQTPYTYSSGPEKIICTRMITSGTDHNSIHLLASAFEGYMGQPSAMVYSRSQDGGMSWNIENVVLEGTGEDYYYEIWVDKYVWAEERAGTIALLISGAWMDLFMLKSTDDGDSWEKTVIWEHPYPLFDFSYNTDPFFCVDNSATIALDSEGKAHVVFGINRVRYENGSYFYPYVDGIGYWNEDMDTFSNDIDALAPPGTGYGNSEMIEDYNYIGWMQDVDGDSIITLNSEMCWYRSMGPSTMPSITIDDLDQIFILYASTTETYEIGDYNYKHIWGRTFANGVWGPFVDLSADVSHLIDECIYPVLAFSSDDNIHYIYNADHTPGLAIDNWHAFEENRLIYGALPKYDLLTGVEDDIDLLNDHLLIQNYPNPFSSATTLSYILEKPSSVTIRIFNSQGQLIKKIIRDQPGGEQQFLWNAEELPAGIYYYRIHTDDQVGSGKMILMK